MSARRKERLAEAGLRQFEQDINDVLWDNGRIPEDPGTQGEYAGFFPATYPWVEIDVSTNDNGCAFWNYGDLKSLCGKCGRRATSNECQCEGLNVLQTGLKIKAQIKPAPAKKPSAPPNLIRAPPPKPSVPQGFVQSPPSEDMKTDEVAPPPPPKPVQAARPREPPDPGIKLKEQLVPKLVDVRTDEQLRFYLSWFGAEYKQDAIPRNITKKLEKELKSIEDWDTFHNHSESVYGNTDLYKGLGFSYGTPLRFREAKRWTPALAELSSEISLVFPDIHDPINLTAVQRYMSGQSCNRHKDREPECRDSGFTIIVALGPREFTFSNKLHKGPGYVEVPFKMNTGDAIFIPRELNYGSTSLFHYKKPAEGDHYTIVLKSAKPPPSST